eukprot:gb/GECG01015466.1/.p1 GENE.gb/GECG01015466.1/~~gb/GECG01015466.1/.p1  ORF type:complete len:217 (+),score=32.84 gb/GECG01015466.1/:1-651(+)
MEPFRESDSVGESQKASSGESRKRLRRACQPCAASKIKCDQRRPCAVRVLKLYVSDSSKKNDGSSNLQECVRKEIPHLCIDKLSVAEKRKKATHEYMEQRILSGHGAPQASSTVGESGGIPSLVDWAFATVQLRKSEFIPAAHTPIHLDGGGGMCVDRTLNSAASFSLHQGTGASEALSSNFRVLQYSGLEQDESWQRSSNEPRRKLQEVRLLQAQ